MQKRNSKMFKFLWYLICTVIVLSIIATIGFFIWILPTIAHINEKILSW